MRPPKMSYEKIPVGVEVVGIIEKIEYDEKHSFKGFEGKEGTIQSGVRIVLRLDGCQYLHKTRWMKFNVGSKATLYKKYLVALVEDAVPDMDIDLDVLNGMSISTVWKDNGDFQNLEEISAIGPKIKQDAAVPVVDLNDTPPEPTEEEATF